MATNAHDPPYRTLNECFIAFRTIWVHLGPFGCLTKLGAKQAELVQKFVPRSCVGIFRNECTRSNPLNPKLTFWCMSDHLGAFGTVLLPYKLGAKRAELVQKFVPRCRVGIFRNERTRSSTLDPRTNDLVRFILFGCIQTDSLPYETRCKTGRSTPLDNELTFWCVSH